jgi:DNA-binding response OmpR family regulator
VRALTASRVVLVVEDDDSIRHAIERLLRANGFKTMAHASAEALLEAGAVPDAVCVISDIKLPAMSGLELVRELRARGGWPPVVVITANDTPERRDEAIRSGACAYLAKPFLGDEVVAAIQVAIDLRKP